MVLLQEWGHEDCRHARGWGQVAGVSDMWKISRWAIRFDLRGISSVCAACCGLSGSLDARFLDRFLVPARRPMCQSGLVSWRNPAGQR